MDKILFSARFAFPYIKNNPNHNIMCVWVCICMRACVCVFKGLYVYFRFFLMYLINKDETEHTGQVIHPAAVCLQMC